MSQIWLLLHSHAHNLAFQHIQVICHRLCFRCGTGLSQTKLMPYNHSTVFLVLLQFYLCKFIVLLTNMTWKKYPWVDKFGKQILSNKKILTTSYNFFSKHCTSCLRLKVPEMFVEDLCCLKWSEQSHKASFRMLRPPLWESSTSSARFSYRLREESTVQERLLILGY